MSRHALYMKYTLAPDLRESGRKSTAEDVEHCAALVLAGRKDKRYARWLRTTLIPDLRASGMRETAKDLAKCARAIK